MTDSGGCQLLTDKPVFGILGLQFQKACQVSHWLKNVQRTVHLLRPIENSVQKKTNKNPPCNMEICNK